MKLFSHIARGLICRIKLGTPSIVKTIFVGLFLVSCRPSMASSITSAQRTEPALQGIVSDCLRSPAPKKTLILNHKPLLDFTARQISIADTGCVQIVAYQPNGLTISDIRYKMITPELAQIYLSTWTDATNKEMVVAKRPTGVVEGDIHTVHFAHFASNALASMRSLNLAKSKQIHDFLDVFRDMQELPNTASSSVVNAALRCETVSSRRAKGINSDSLIKQRTLETIVGNTALEACLHKPRIFIPFEHSGRAINRIKIKEGMFRFDTGLVQFSIFEYAKVRQP